MELLLNDASMFLNASRPTTSWAHIEAEPTPSLKGGGSGGDPDDSLGLSAVGPTRMDTDMLTLSNPSGTCLEGYGGRTIFDIFEGMYVVDSQGEGSVFLATETVNNCEWERFIFEVSGSDRHLQLYFFDMGPIDLDSFLP